MPDNTCSIEPEEVDQKLKDLFSSPIKLTSVSGFSARYNEQMGEKRADLHRIINVSSLTEEIVDLVLSAATYEVFSYVEESGYWRSSVMLSESDEAINHLCKIDSPITSNILHLVAQKRNISVTMFEGCGQSTEVTEAVSFQNQREQALNELKRRGNPLYQLETYIKTS